jgi:hypothetical protein
LTPPPPPKSSGAWRSEQETIFPHAEVVSVPLPITMQINIIFLPHNLWQ